MLPIKVIDVLIFSSRTFLGFGQGAVNIVRNATGLCDIGHEPSFFFFLDVLHLLNLVRKIVCDRVESVRTLQRFLERGLGGNIALLEMDVRAVLEEILGSRFVGITSQCANLEASVPHTLLDRVRVKPHSWNLQEL